MIGKGLTEEAIAYDVPANIRGSSWVHASSPVPDRSDSYRLWLWDGTLSYAGAPRAGIGAHPIYETAVLL